MSSLLTHRDLEKWLGSAGTLPIRAPNVRLGLAGSLYDASLSLLSSIAPTVQAKDDISPQLLHSYINETERFFLWGDGFSAMDGRLDSILNQSSEIRTEVVKLLYEAGIAIQSRFHHQVKLSQLYVEILTMP